MFVCMREGEREKEGEGEKEGERERCMCDACVMHVRVAVRHGLRSLAREMHVCVHACSYIEPEVTVSTFIGFLRMPISKVILSAYVKSDFQTWFGELKKTAQAADDEDR